MWATRMPWSASAASGEADKNHHFTLVCRDLSEIAHYARVDTWQFRLLKAHTPGPFTFLLPATRETPQRLQHPKRRTIGIRVPEHPVPHLLLAELGEPLMSSTLLLPGDEEPLTDGAPDPGTAGRRAGCHHRRRPLRHRAHHGAGPCGLAAGGAAAGQGPHRRPYNAGDEFGTHRGAAARAVRHAPHRRSCTSATTTARCATGWPCRMHHECYFFVADWHALTTDYENPGLLQQHVHEMVVDWLAAGLDPERAPSSCSRRCPAMPSCTCCCR